MNDKGSRLLLTGQMRQVNIKCFRQMPDKEGLIDDEQEQKWQKTNAIPDQGSKIWSCDSQKNTEQEAIQ